MKFEMRNKSACFDCRPGVIAARSTMRARRWSSLPPYLRPAMRRRSIRSHRQISAAVVPRLLPRPQQRRRCLQAQARHKRRKRQSHVAATVSAAAVAVMPRLPLSHLPRPRRPPLALATARASRTRRRCVPIARRATTTLWSAIGDCWTRSTRACGTSAHKRARRKDCERARE